MPSVKFSTTFRNINVHEVNGNVEAITFLQNTDFHFVEGLFFFAKRYGKSEFSYKGKNYELIRNRNITYTVREKPDEEQALAEAFR